MNIKFDKAEEYFQASPHLKVGEVAEKIGYDDPLYFSRIYKKYRKISPSQFHKKFS
jgi:YesN/AraC family two-component response regulator